jgi:hypothetical protein
MILAIPCKPFGFIAPNVFELFGSPTFSENTGYRADDTPGD